MGTSSNKTKRKEHDFYATPSECITNFLHYYKFRKSDNILEPSAGNGAISKEIKKQYPDCYLKQIELRAQEAFNLDKYGDVSICNFLTFRPKRQYDIVIGNPPYSLALEFVQRCVRLRHQQEVIMLLPLSFLGSAKRYEFFQKNPLSSLYVLSHRPSFTGSGTAHECYGWFVWNGRNNGVKVI